MGIDAGSFLEGLSTAFHPMNLLWVLIGGFLGTVVGMLPGLGPCDCGCSTHTCDIWYGTSKRIDFNGFNLLWCHVWWLEEFDFIKYTR